MYRLQGVKINDKHIETIVRQMLQKAQVTDPGIPIFSKTNLVDRFRFLDENDKVIAEGGDRQRTIRSYWALPAPRFLTESFISAASFKKPPAC